MPAPGFNPTPASSSFGPTLTLNRSGKFTLRVTGNSHCGIVPPGAPAEVHCKYTFVMCCAAEGLDDQGFLVEQVGIDTYFQSLPRTKLSCEMLVVHCAKELYQKVMRENPRCRVQRISLMIQPSSPNRARGRANMTFEWDVANDPEAQRQFDGGRGRSRSAHDFILEKLVEKETKVARGAKEQTGFPFAKVTDPDSSWYGEIGAVEFTGDGNGVTLRFNSGVRKKFRASQLRAARKMRKTRKVS